VTTTAPHVNSAQGDVNPTFIIIPYIVRFYPAKILSRPRRFIGRYQSNFHTFARGVATVRHFRHVPTHNFFALAAKCAYIPFYPSYALFAATTVHTRVDVNPLLAIEATTLHTRVDVNPLLCYRGHDGPHKSRCKSTSISIETTTVHTRVDVNPLLCYRGHDGPHKSRCKSTSLLSRPRLSTQE